MKINVRGMCRGEGSLSLAVACSGADPLPSFELFCGDTAVPVRVHPVDAAGFDGCNVVLSFPFFKGVRYELCAGGDRRAVLTRLSSDYAALQSKMGYVLKKQFSVAVRDASLACAQPATRAVMTQFAWELYEDAVESELIQGYLRLHDAQNEVVVRCLDERGHDVTSDFVVTRPMMSDSDHGECLVDFALRFPCLDGDYFVVVEELASTGERIQPWFRYITRSQNETYMHQSPINVLEADQFAHYHDWFTTVHARTADELQAQREITLEAQPVFSIVVPLFRTPELLLLEMIESVLAQTYPHWELCLVNASPEDESLKAALEHIAGLGDQRIVMAELPQNYGISQNTNEAIALASCDYIILFDHDDLLTPDALFEMAQAINENPAADFLYSDEDHMMSDSGLLCFPHFKPDFNKRLLWSCNYITHLSAIKRSLIDEVGTFDHEFDGAQDYDMILRLAGAAQCIVHVPRVLYHWREHAGSTASDISAKTYAIDAGKNALERYLSQRGIARSVEHARRPCYYVAQYELDDDLGRSVSALVFDEGLGLESPAIRSLMDMTAIRDITLLTTQDIEGSETVSVKRIQGSAPASINRIIRGSQCEYVVLLAGNMAIRGEGDIGRLVAVASQEDVGCAAGKTYYQDDTIEHFGRTYTEEGSITELFRGLPRWNTGYQNRALCTQDVSMVSLSFAVIKKSAFDAVGGLTELYQAEYFDADFCLKLRAKGLCCVVTPEAEATHISQVKHGRGNRVAPESDRADRAYFADRWAEVLSQGDPLLNPHIQSGLPNWNLAKFARD